MVMDGRAESVFLKARSWKAKCKEFRHKKGETMPHLQRLAYLTGGVRKTIDLSGDSDPTEALRTTVITGRNGSYKSTMLLELLAALVLPERSSDLSYAPEDAGNSMSGRVLCTSGSAADRFPLKSIGPKSTAFALSKYVYLGQRVAPNLLSKKEPLETIAVHALSDGVIDRFQWPFFEETFDLIGLRPQLRFQFRRKRRDFIAGPRESLRFVQAVADGLKTKNTAPVMAEDMARWILDEFEYGDFKDLDYYLDAKATRMNFDLSPSGVKSLTDVPAGVIRLGLVLDQLAMGEVLVYAKDSGDAYSAFELSSGEYHVLTTILGLGFAIQPDSVVLMDEPETSLHPRWQQDLMRIVVALCGSMSRNHLVVSTHSPLIVGAAPSGSVIVDLERSEGSHSSSATNLFGSSTDRILFEQFDIASSRNPYVVDIVRRAVSIVEEQKTDGPEFQAILIELQDLLGKLSADDPLSGIVQALIGDEG